jgi:hypothetical protein
MMDYEIDKSSSLHLEPLADVNVPDCLGMQSVRFDMGGWDCKGNDGHAMVVVGGRKQRDAGKGAICGSQRQSPDRKTNDSYSQWQTGDFYSILFTTIHLTRIHNKGWPWQSTVR